jgi:plasmid maintenance system antidote protein VapI
VSTSRPRPVTDGDSWVEAAPFRAHLRHLMAVGGLSSGTVAQLAGISPRLAVSLLQGRAGRPLRRISPETARRLLRVTAAEARAVRGRSVPARATTGLLGQLWDAGWSDSELAQLLGLPLGAVVALRDGSTVVCTQLTALRAAAAAELQLSLTRTEGQRARAAA